MKTSKIAAAFVLNGIIFAAPLAFAASSKPVKTAANQTATAAGTCHDGSPIGTIVKGVNLKEDCAKKGPYFRWVESSKSASADKSTKSQR